jgi:hypothetical protein
VYTNETRESCTEVTQACGGVEVGGIAILPVLRDLEGLLGFERNGRGAVTGLETISTPRRNGQFP